MDDDMADQADDGQLDLPGWARDEDEPADRDAPPAIPPPLALPLSADGPVEYPREVQTLLDSGAITEADIRRPVGEVEGLSVYHHHLAKKGMSEESFVDHIRQNTSAPPARKRPPTVTGNPLGRPKVPPFGLKPAPHPLMVIIGKRLQERARTRDLTARGLALAIWDWGRARSNARKIWAPTPPTVAAWFTGQSIPALEHLSITMKVLGFTDTEFRSLYAMRKVIGRRTYPDELFDLPNTTEGRYKAMRMIAEVEKADREQMLTHFRDAAARKKRDAQGEVLRVGGRKITRETFAT